MDLTGDTVRLRPLLESDAPEWLVLLNDPAVMEGMDRVDEVSAEQHRGFYEKVIRRQPSLWFAIESRSAPGLAGGIWLWDVHPRHRRAEVRIFVAPGAGGKGYGTESIGLLAAYAFDVLKLHKLYAYVHVANTASKRAFERAGFVQEALLREEALRSGSFTDVYRYALIAGS